MVLADGRSQLRPEGHHLMSCLLAPLDRIEAACDHGLRGHPGKPCGHRRDGDAHDQLGAERGARADKELDPQAAPRRNRAWGDGRSDHRVEPAMQLAFELPVEVICHIHNNALPGRTTRSFSSR